MPAVAPLLARRPTGWRPRVRPALGVAFGSFVVIGTTDAALGTAWPAIRHSLDLPIGDLGLVQLAGTAGFLLSSAVSGRLSARLGRAATMAASAAVGCVALAVFATAPALVLLLVATFAVGLAGGQIEPGMQSHVALTARARTMNFLHGCYGVGATIGPILISSLLVLHASWRLAYLLLVAIEAAVAVGVVRRRGNFDQTSPVRRRSASASATRATHASAAERPLPRLALATALLLFFVYCGVEIGTGQWAFTLLTTGRHFGTGSAGVLVAGFWAALTAVRFLVAATGERVHPDVVLLASAGGAVLGEALLWWNPTRALGALGLVLTGASLAPAFPLMMTRTPRWVDRAQVSSVIGWQSAAASLGIAALSGCAALLVQRFGLGALCPYLTVLSAVFFVLQLAALRVQAPHDRLPAAEH